MNKILSTFSASGQPFRSPTHLDFLQGAYKEGIANAIIAMIGESYNTAKVYRLWGAQVINTGGDYYPNTAGAVFYNGEIYTVDAVGGIGTNMPDGFAMKIVTSATDNTLFGDGSTHSINQVRKMAFVDSADGSAIPNSTPINYRFFVTVPEPITGNSVTLYHTNNNYTRITATSSSAITITLANTRRAAGVREVLYITPDGSGNDINISATSGTVYTAGQTAAAPSANTLQVVIEYAGNDVYFASIYSQWT